MEMMDMPWGMVFERVPGNMAKIQSMEAARFVRGDDAVVYFPYSKDACSYWDV